MSAAPVSFRGVASSSNAAQKGSGSAQKGSSSAQKGSDQKESAQKDSTKKDSAKKGSDQKGSDQKGSDQKSSDQKDAAQRDVESAPKVRNRVNPEVGSPLHEPANTVLQTAKNLDTDAAMNGVCGMERFFVVKSRQHYAQDVPLRECMMPNGGKGFPMVDMPNNRKVDDDVLRAENLFYEMGPWNPLHLMTVFLAALVWFCDGYIAKFIMMAYQQSPEDEVEYRTLAETLTLELTDQHFFSVNIQGTVILSSSCIFIFSFFFERRKPLTVLGLVMLQMGLCCLCLRSALFVKAGFFLCRGGSYLASCLVLLNAMGSLPYHMRIFLTTILTIASACGQLICLFGLLIITDYVAFPVASLLTPVVLGTIYLYRRFGHESVHFMITTKHVHQLKKYVELSNHMSGVNGVQLDVDQLVDDVIYRETLPNTKREELATAITNRKILPNAIIGLVMWISFNVNSDFTVATQLPTYGYHMEVVQRLGVIVMALPLSMLALRRGRRITFRVVLFLCGVVCLCAFLSGGVLGGNDGVRCSRPNSIIYFGSILQYLAVNCRLMSLVVYLEFISAELRMHFLLITDVINSVFLECVNGLRNDDDTPQESLRVDYLFAAWVSCVGFLAATLYQEFWMMPVVLSDIIPNKDEPEMEEVDEEYLIMRKKLEEMF